jgi:hypothetical protein
MVAPKRRAAHGSSESIEGRAMAIVRIVQPQMITTEIYDQVNAKMGIEDSPPDGLIVHTAGFVDGVFQIVDVWESAEHARRFDTERLVPAITEVIGAGPPGEPQSTEYELHGLVKP